MEDRRYQKMPQAVWSQSYHPGPGTGRFYLQEIQYRKVVNHTDYIITLPKHKS